MHYICYLRDLKNIDPKRDWCLNNYRNHKFLELVLKKNIILICGKNGSGKTNILESISLLTSSSGLKKTNCVDRGGNA